MIEPPEDDARSADHRAESPPELDATASIAGAAGTASAIGRYRLIRLLGEGGMGSVYLAEQDQPRQDRARQGSGGGTRP